jgi:ABC-type dipeptide/oligopeptide/nickel transport system ATPase component
MGIEPDLFEALLPHKGLGLVCGETGSGKSTLLAAIYRYCADHYPDRKITTAEDPVEYIIGRKGDVLPATQLSSVGMLPPSLKPSERRFAGLRPLSASGKCATQKPFWPPC